MFCHIGIITPKRNSSNSLEVTKEIVLEKENIFKVNGTRLINAKHLVMLIPLITA